MLLEKPNKHNDSEKIGEYIVNPPCGIVVCIEFINGCCPISSETDCRDCISNEFDAACVERLCTATKFGRT